MEGGDPGDSSETAHTTSVESTALSGWHRSDRCTVSALVTDLGAGRQRSKQVPNARVFP